MEKDRDETTVLFMVILILLIFISVISGFFYFGFVLGNFGLTGHIVLSGANTTIQNSTMQGDLNNSGALGNFINASNPTGNP